MAIEEGKAAPAFKLKDQDGNAVSLADFKGKQNVVLYFYPKDDTPGCTKEACGFRDAHEDMVGKGARVLGISRDDAETLQRFKAELKLPYDLVADVDGKLTALFEVKQLGGLLSRPKRVTYLIDKTGVVRGVFHHELSANAHVKDALEALQKLA